MTTTKKNTSNKSFLIHLGIIVFFGLIILASATSVIGYNAYDGDTYYFLKHQLLFGLLPGLFLFWLCSKIPYKFFEKHAGKLLFFSLILLLLVFIPGIGTHYNKARSWINIAGFSLQPSEIVKLTFAIYLAVWFSKTREHVKSFSHGLIPFVILLGIPVLLIALQPDLGTALILVFISIAIYFSAGAKWKHLLTLFITGGVAVGGMILAAPYRMNRFLAFLNPNFDPQGAGYHISQSLIAVGSGGLLGLGFGKSRQKFEYLPEVAGDSIFAILAEELGFIISAIFVLLIIFFVLKLFKYAKNSKDDFAKYLIIGIATWIGIQSVINIGAMLGVMPLTGVPLPFVSYGGTSMMILLASCGIVNNIIRR